MHGEGLAGERVEDIAVVGAHVLGDGDELFHRVVVELDGAGEARGEAGVGGEEAHHFLGIAGADDDDLVAVVLDELDERIDGLLDSKVYASSMNSTPPRAFSNTSVVLMAVPPMTWATRSDRDTSTMWPEGSIPSVARILP
jgi:hypothetical protein